MTYENEKIINCSEFEDILTDYLDSSLDKLIHKAVAAHALRCPLCHGLLNEVKDALELCREISAPKISITSSKPEFCRKPFLKRQWLAKILKSI